MPLQKQLVPMVLSAGLDQKTDSFSVQAPHLLDLQNAEFTKAGKLSKRKGYSQLSTSIEGGGAIQAAQAISAYGDELLLFTGQRLYSFLEATGTWIDRGLAVSVIAKDHTIRRVNNTQQLNPDVAYSEGIEVYAWEDESGAVMYSVLDSATGAFAVSNGLVAATCIKPRLAVFANVVYVFYTDGINNLFYRAINPHNPTVLGAQTTVAGDITAWGGFDVRGTSTLLYLAYLATPASGTITAKSYDTTMTATSTVFIATGAAATDGTHSAVDVFVDSEAQIWVSWSTGTDVRTSAFGFQFSTILASHQVAAGALCPALTGLESDTAGKLLLVYEVHSSDPTKELTKTATVTTTGTVVAVATQRSVGIASRGFTQGGHRYVTLAYQSVLQATYFTVYLDDTTFPVVSKQQSGTGGGLRTNGTVSNVMPVSATALLYANGTRGKGISEANTFFSLVGVNATVLDYSSANKFLSATQSRNLFVVGGVLSSYDGVSVTEHLFHLYPEEPVLAAAGSDGFLGTGTYQYAVTYEWTDNEGQIQRSAPSVAEPLSVTATNHVTLTIPTLRLTSKRGTRSPPSIVVYRSTANGAPDVLFRVTDTLAPLLNDPTVDTVTYVDVLSDADAIDTELLYTAGGVLDNIAPPSHSLISLYQGRVVLGGMADPNLLWFSKNKFDNTNFNTVPVEFAQELTIGVDSRGGGVTALGLLDDKLIIFKESSIFYITGDGPNDTGGGTPFGDPILLTTDVGCVNPNSVIVSPVGIMFQSAKGKYLLDRSAQASYIGAPVEDFNSLTVTSATLLQDTNQVVFTHSNDTALVYDYYFQQWGTWTNHAAEDSDLFNGSFAIVRPTGQVLVRDDTRFDDAGKAVYMSFITPWFQFGGPNGFQRIYKALLLGQYKSAHRLHFDVGYDFNTVFTQSADVDASQGVTAWGSDPVWGAPGTVWGGPFKIFEYRIDFATQRCTSMRLRISDTQGKPYGEGWSASALTLEVGAMPGGNRLVAGQIVGTQ